MTTKHEKCRDCGDHHAPPSGRCERHEGWENRETWAVALAIDNNRQRLEGAVKLAEAHVAITDIAGKDGVRSMLEETLKMLCGGLRARKGDDFASMNLWPVNWRELAEHYITKARESAAVKS